MRCLVLGLLSVALCLRVQAPLAKTKKAAHPHQARLTRKGRFRSNKCWRLYRDVRASIQRQGWVLRLFQRFPCDVKAWRKCKRRRYRGPLCSRKMRLKWGKCFRIHRRLFVITYRMHKWSREARKSKCRWKVRIPERFDPPVFSPFPKINKP